VTASWTGKWDAATRSEDNEIPDFSGSDDCGWTACVSGCGTINDASRHVRSSHHGDAQQDVERPHDALVPFDVASPHDDASSVPIDDAHASYLDASYNHAP
jgi:hypothetical protein